MLNIAVHTLKWLVELAGQACGIWVSGYWSTVMGSGGCKQEAYCSKIREGFVCVCMGVCVSVGGCLCTYMYGIHMYQCKDGEGRKG